jgi:spermidine/putrescine-binding protein
MIENLIIWLLAAAPAITAILGIVAAAIGIFKNNKTNYKALADKFEEVKQQVLDMKEYQSLKDQLQIVHQENIELRKKLNELLTAMTNVTHKD